MFDCKKCRKKFKSSQALGGHMVSAHPRSKAASAPANNSSGTGEKKKEVKAEAASQVQPTPSEEPGVMERIRSLMRKGHSPKQIKELFGYAPRTVDQVGEEFIEPDAPAVNRGEFIPAKLKRDDIITPEFIMQRLENSGDDWRLRLEGMMLLRVAQKMNREDAETEKIRAEVDARRIEPLLKMIEVSRSEMDAAAQRARESSMEIAQTAAMGAAGGMMGRIDAGFDRLLQQKPDIAQAPDPMKGLMARTMEMMMNRLTGMLSGSQVGPTPGLVDKRVQG